MGRAINRMPYTYDQSSGKMASQSDRFTRALCVGDSFGYSLFNQNRALVLPMVDALTSFSLCSIKIHWQVTYRRSGNFRCKYFYSRWLLRKLILRKLAHTINNNAIRGHSYENFLTRKFIIRKFLYKKISRFTVAFFSTAFLTLSFGSPIVLNLGMK